MLNSYVDLTQNSVIQSTQFDLDYGVAAVSRALTPKSRISINRGVFLKLNFLFSRLRFDSKTARISTENNYIKHCSKIESNCIISFEEETDHDMKMFCIDFIRVL